MKTDLERIFEHVSEDVRQLLLYLRSRETEQFGKRLRRLRVSGELGA